MESIDAATKRLVHYAVTSCVQIVHIIENLFSLHGYVLYDDVNSSMYISNYTSGF